MAKYKADITFKGIKEKQVFNKDDEFDMTIKRSEEITETIKAEYPEIKTVMTRIDVEEEPKDAATNPKSPKSKKE